MRLARKIVPRTIACAVLCTAAAAQRAGAQGVQLRVVDSTTMTALGGALVALLDRGGAAVAEGLTSENGFRTFFVPPGPYSVRVRRVGYRPYVSAASEMSHSRTLTIAVQSDPVVLSTIVISARTRCSSLRSTNSQALGTVWGEATKAIEASKLTLSDLRGVGRAWKYTRTVGVLGTPPRGDTAHFTVTNLRPFTALDPDSLANAGYVIGDAQTGWTYFAPDETVLLSSSFARTHCFRLVRDRYAPDLIGVAFEPVRGRTAADIAGTAWLDQQTSELRRIVFRFVNAGLISRHGGGGETNFRRLPSGAWIISSWHLRAPILIMRRGVIGPEGSVENGGGLHPPG
ncbi:MAG: carboxypeptidase-like regulatory domain-containing protein [Gemmatimonadaceae bacterium]